jgi:hypothetical protein
MGRSSFGIEGYTSHVDRFARRSLPPAEPQPECIFDRRRGTGGNRSHRRDT